MSIVLGLGMAFLAVLLALAVAVFVPLSQMPSLSGVCEALKVDAVGCSAAATQTALVSIAALLPSVVAGIAIVVWMPKPKIEPSQLDDNVSHVVLALIAVFVATLVAIRVWSPIYADRMEEINAYSDFISLENLTWPLLLQIMVLQKSAHLRTGCLALLAVLMANTTYRTMILSVISFGLVQPLACDLIRAYTARQRREMIRKYISPVLLAVALSSAAAWSVYDSQGNRGDFLGSSDIQELRALFRSKWSGASAGAERQEHSLLFASPRQDFEPKVALHPLCAPLTSILQRIAAPLFQASLLERVVKSDQPPGIGDELRSKLRIGREWPLNVYAYHKLYGGSGIGQTTALTYGEAIAYFPRKPFIWMIFVPLSLLFTWVVLRAVLTDAQMLFGLALWRSSLAGVVTILPSLVLQVAAIVGMVSISRILRSCNAINSARIQSISKALFLIGVVLMLFVQCLSVFKATSSNYTWRIAVAPSQQGCHFDWTESNKRKVDRALARQGILVRISVDRTLELENDLPVLSLISIPDGMRAREFREQVRSALAVAVLCSTAAAGPAPMFVSEWLSQITGRLALDYCAIALLLSCIGLSLVLNSSHGDLDIVTRGNQNS